MYLIIRISEYLLSNYEYFAISGAYFWWIAFFCQQFATPVPPSNLHKHFTNCEHASQIIFLFAPHNVKFDQSRLYIFAIFSSLYRALLAHRFAILDPGGFEGNGDYRRGQPEVEVNQRSLLFIKKMFLVNSE